MHVLLCFAALFSRRHFTAAQNRPKALRSKEVRTERTRGPASLVPAAGRCTSGPQNHVAQQC